MLKVIKDIFMFIKDWSELGLIFVGSFALVVYWLQERRKKTEAASLIISQITELQNRLHEIVIFTSAKTMNSVSFYESLILLENNYWNQYKHYFIKDMDTTSYHQIDTFYKYVSEINQQQLIIKDLQKDTFYRIRNIVGNLEEKCLYDEIRTSNMEYDSLKILRHYQEQKEVIKYIMDNMDTNATYIPQQTLISLEKVLKQYALLEVAGTDGYRKLKKIAGRNF